MQEEGYNIVAKKAKRATLSKEMRLDHLRKWKQSNLSMRKYCRQEKLPLSSFSKWSHDIKLDLAKPTFKPIAILKGLEEESPGVEILIDQRIKIRLDKVTDPLFVVKIVKELVGCN